MLGIGELLVEIKGGGGGKGELIVAFNGGGGSVGKVLGILPKEFSEGGVGRVGNVMLESCGGGGGSVEFKDGGGGNNPP